MSKAPPHLILCSDDVEFDTRHQSCDRSFQPAIIDGGERTIDASWVALLGLCYLSLLAAQANYLALLRASLAALEPDAG
ncbi:hypothetical protein AS156_38845 [Bradyrhizobium macuxiense]|uniref:Uncharacterized protein n=1 Tax=Bradyrhizobium macuxiense TaxID=1755647 RepID=A0A120FPY5_9BRAD|nr:hypothetical protein [Bradyrhizobium macuxiense]KWV57664.1 hypothetical protein AS156_38845 [Bradyrhizobium macuxiense]